MGLASVDLWNIVDEPKRTHLPTLISKERKEKKNQITYQEDNVHYYTQLDGQSTCVHQRLQKIIIGMKGCLRHL